MPSLAKSYMHQRFCTLVLSFLHDLTQVFDTPAALPQECYTQPGCIGDLLQNVTNEFDCCMQGQLEASVFDNDTCYFLQCLGEYSTLYHVTVKDHNVFPIIFSSPLPL